MNIFITRNPGWYGTLVPMDLLCNGRCLAHVREKETVHVQLTQADIPAKLQLRMQSAVGSPTIEVISLSSDLYLECGANNWTLLDFFDLSLLTGFKYNVFYFRKVVPE
jgi:hypothetical protein